MNYSELSNLAIAKEIGSRLEQIRLEQNRTQRELAHEIGLTPVSYRNLIAGKGKFENVIALIRALRCVEMLEVLLLDTHGHQTQHSSAKGKGKRSRASGRDKVNVTSRL